MLHCVMCSPIPCFVPSILLPTPVETFLWFSTYSYILLSMGSCVHTEYTFLLLYPFAINYHYHCHALGYCGFPSRVCVGSWEVGCRVVVGCLHPCSLWWSLTWCAMIQVSISDGSVGGCPQPWPPSNWLHATHELHALLLQTGPGFCSSVLSCVLLADGPDSGQSGLHTPLDRYHRDSVDHFHSLL